MASRSCEDCGINFPAHDQFRTCIACGMYTVYWSLGMEDTNWKGKAEVTMARLATLKLEAFEVTHVDALVTTDEEGLMWLSSHDAIRAGTANMLTMAETDVISIGPPDPRTNHPDDNLYEVIAYVDAKRAYWVRPLRVPDHA